MNDNNDNYDENDRVFKATEMMDEWCSQVKCHGCPCYPLSHAPETCPRLWRKLVLPKLPRPGRVVDDLDDREDAGDRLVKMIQDDTPVATAPTVEELDGKLDHNSRVLDDALDTLAEQGEKAKARADRQGRVLGYIGVVIFGLGIYQFYQLVAGAVEKIAAAMGW